MAMMAMYNPILLNDSSLPPALFAAVFAITDDRSSMTRTTSSSIRGNRGHDCNASTHGTRPRRPGTWLLAVGTGISGWRLSSSVSTALRTASKLVFMRSPSLMSKTWAKQNTRRTSTTEYLGVTQTEGKTEEAATQDNKVDHPHYHAAINLEGGGEAGSNPGYTVWMFRQLKIPSQINIEPRL